MAVNNYKKLPVGLKKYGADKFIISADVRDGKVRTSGWTEDSGMSINDLLKRYWSLGVRNVLCTDISRDGMLCGPNIQLYKEIMSVFPDCKLTASGGVKDINDIEALNDAGIDSVVFGRAIYEGTIDLKQVAVKFKQSKTMLAKRIIPCLDVKDGRTVKGINFLGLRDAGDPVEMGKIYSEQMADELVFLDITASVEGRKTFTEMVRRVASELSIPFTVGGGVSTLNDVERLLEAGADKVAVNSAALRTPALIDEIASHFGSQICVLAIDAKKKKKTENGIAILTEAELLRHTHLFDWAREGYNRGAGEILFTSMNHDGTKEGFANEALCKISESVGIPLIASGGAGKKKDFRDAFVKVVQMQLWRQVYSTMAKLKFPSLNNICKKENIDVRLQ